MLPHTDVLLPNTAVLLPYTALLLAQKAVLLPHNATFCVLVILVEIVPLYTSLLSMKDLLDADTAVFEPKKAALEL